MPERLSKEQLRRAYETVFTEIVRYGRMTIAELRSLPQFDHFCSLPHPSGQGQMTIGRLAEENLRHIAYEILALNRLQNVVSKSSMRNLLGEELVKRFLVEKRLLDQSQIDRLSSFLGRKAKETCVSRRHLVPCHLFHVQEPDELPIGPVIFRSRRNFQHLIMPAVRAYDKGKDGVWARHLARILHYYRSFRWVIDVPVVAADDDTSQKIAMESARAAVNALNIALGAQSTKKVVLGGPRIIHDNRGHLVVNTNGDLLGTLSMTGPGEIGAEKGWSKQIPGSEFRFFLDLLGVALESAVDPELRRPLSRRLLDAIYWFGEAVRESSDAASVIKYVTALERMLMTRERDDICSIISDRCAAFVWINGKDRTLNAWKTEIAGLYDLRSRLVHGDLSPTSIEVSEGLQRAAHVTRMAILSVLHHLGEHGMRAENVPNRELAGWFDNIVNQSRCLSAGPEPAL